MRITVLFACTLAASVAAQTTTKLATETVVGVFADSGLNAVKQGTAIVSGRPLSLSALVRGASATSSVALAELGGVFGGVKFQHTAQVSTGTTFNAGTAATGDPRAIQPAPHSFLLELSGQKFNGFALTMSSRIVGRSRGSVAVDIGADSRVEFQQAADGKPYTRALSFTGSSVKVRITIDGLVGPGASIGISLELLPTTSTGCLITPYGQSCPNTTLVGKVGVVSGNYQFSLQVSNGLPNAPLAWVAGIQTASIPLPGSPCTLLTTPLVILGATADSTGMANLPLSFPTATKGSAFLQAIPFDPKQNVIFASNGLRVDCR